MVANAKSDVTGDVRALIAKAMQTEEIITCLCDQHQLSHGGCVCGAAMRMEFLARRT